MGIFNSGWKKLACMERIGKHDCAADTNISFSFLYDTECWFPIMRDPVKSVGLENCLALPNAKFSINFTTKTY